MLLDVGLLLRDLPVVTAILLGMLLLKAAVVAVVAKPATKSWFKSLRTGVVVAQGGEFGFALADSVAAARTARSGHRAAAAGRHRFEHGAIAADHPPQSAHHARHSARIRQLRTPRRCVRNAVTLAAAEREHVVICGFGRVGQNIARVLEQTGFEYIALDVDPYRIRTGRQAGDPVVYGDAGQVKVLENVGVAHASVVVITFANPDVALRILRAVRELRSDVPILVRTQDDTKLDGIAGGRRDRGGAGDLRGQPHAAVAPAAVGEAAGRRG